MQRRELVAIILFILGILAGSAWGIIMYFRYNRLISTESDKCLVYSCGTETSNTDQTCVPTGTELAQHQPMYAYRTSSGGGIECQKDRARNQRPFKNDS